MQNFLARLSNTEKIIFYIALPVVLLAAYDRLLVGPALSSLRRLDDKIAHEEGVVKSNLKYLSYRGKIERERKAYEKYILSTPIDNKEINRNFLGVVETLSGQSKVNITRSVVTDTKELEGYTQYFANVDCLGTMENVLSFMHAINTTDELLKIINFRISPRRGEESGQVSVSLMISKLVVTAG
jgi:hypothetical protein